MTPNLEDLLLRHEGMILHCYLDPAGFHTIGVGRLIDKRKGGGISKKEAIYLLHNDIGRCVAEARKAFAWFDDLDDVRQDVIVSLIFNMGLPNLKGFKNMIAAIELKDWERVWEALLDSKWRPQVGETRANELAGMLRNGK